MFRCSITGYRVVILERFYPSRMIYFEEYNL